MLEFLATGCQGL